MNKTHERASYRQDSVTLLPEKPLPDRLHDARTRLTDSILRLSTLTNGLCGGEPVSDEANGGSPTACGFLGLVDMTVTSIYDASSRIEYLCSRIESQVGL